MKPSWESLWNQTERVLAIQQKLDDTLRKGRLEMSSRTMRSFDPQQYNGSIDAKCKVALDLQEIIRQEGTDVARLIRALPSAGIRAAEKAFNEAIDLCVTLIHEQNILLDLVKEVESRVPSSCEPGASEEVPKTRA